MRILNIETSAKKCTVALGNNTELLAHSEASSAFMHSKEITLLINALMVSANLDFNELNAVAVSSGPGSYTGLRVGLSTAKALCYALDIPLIAIPTLKLIAHSQKNHNQSFTIAVIDARRDEVYYQVFDQELNASDNATNLVLDSESLLKWQNSDHILCGDAADKAEKLIGKDKFRYVYYQPDAKDMITLSCESYHDKNFEDTAYFTPFYLKPPNITKSKKPLF